MTLILHTGAQRVSFDDLRAVETPQGTDTHVPVPHHEIVQLIRYTLGFYNHEIVDEAHGITPDGSEYFGVLTLRSSYTDYTDVCGLRNSHSKKFPIGIAFGATVMVCDNLSFFGSHTIRRKHTARAKRELPGLLAEVVEPLQQTRLAQNQTFQRYQQIALTDAQADHGIMSMYRQGIINVQRIADVVNQWENPAHDWGDKTGWRLFNAATFALAGRVSENPNITRDLHQVIDSVCDEV